MNLLFYSYFKPIPSHGGVERVTDIICSGLSSLGHHIYSIYEYDLPGNVNNSFEGVFFLPENNRDEYLGSYLREKEIDVAVIQGRREVVPLFSKQCHALNVKLIYTLHADPGYGYDTFNIDTLVYEIKKSEGFLKWHKIFILLLFPIYRIRCKQILKDSYLKTYSLVDRFVLLSQSSVPYFSELTGLNDLSRVAIISNPLTYKQTFNSFDYLKKEKRILIVSRMEEHSKKISYALRAWKIIEKTNALPGWYFDIVGDGEDGEMYRKWVKDNRLNNVFFHGAQNPIDYYKRSSIFLMTSCSEAWGMSMTEAQQNMCVCIAFDSYCAVRDIIKDGQNGVLVPYPSIKGLVAAIRRVADDDMLRFRMATESIRTVSRFSTDETVCRWNELVCSLNI